jgi:RimJ/RimL family protein N-acetyltransferase
MFALAVLERKVEGKVFVDEKSDPSSFYIQHPYGMSLLFGETKKDNFYVDLASYMLNLEKERNGLEWMQVYPASLYSKIDTILGENLIKKDPNEPYGKSLLQEEETKVLEYERINFIFNQDTFLNFKKRRVDKKNKIVTTSETFYYQLIGSVIPKHFWDNYDDFSKKGIGFSLLDHDFPVSTAFASFIDEEKLEIGIETLKEYQGLGYASIVCAKLIDYCMEKGYEPVWSCNSGNMGSRKLSHKLGFEEIKRVPYYRLAWSQ